MLKKISFFKDKADNRLFVFILAHIFLWTLIPTTLKSWICKDMTEHFLWGLEMEWGYYRHPPFLSWLINAWFYVFPTTNFTYYLLSSVNIGTGFFFIYLIANKVLKSKEKAYVSVLMLELVYFYFFSFKLHHDSILLSLWPICIYFALRAFKEDTLFSWVMLGLMSAVAMLTKYFTAILLIAFFTFYVFQNKKELKKAFLNVGAMLAIVIFLGCLWVLLGQLPMVDVLTKYVTMILFVVCFTFYVFQNKKELNLNVRPMLAIVIFLGCLAPHVVWLFQHDFITFKYVEGRYITKLFPVYYLYFLVMQPVVFAPILWIAHRILKIDLKKDLKPHFSDFENAFLSIIIIVPILVLTLIVFVNQYRLPWRFGMALSTLYGVYIMSRAVVFDEEITKRIQKIVYRFMAICFCIAAIIKISGVKVDSRYHFFPIQKISTHITEGWHKITNTTLKNITGSFLTCEYMAFYSPDHPSSLLKYDFKISPWMSFDKIKKEGIAAICYTSLDNLDIVYSDEDVYDDVQKCMHKAEELFSWQKIDWKEVTFDRFKFKYGFVLPSKK